MSKQDKIAIVGVACRFPGDIENLEQYWQVLQQGQDVVTQIPESRWSKMIYGHPRRKTPGRSYVWSAGVLNNIDQFDADFFGISRREAEQMDPQQRLLLELTWEAFEDASYKIDELAGSNCGVFIGIGSNDYTHGRVDDLSAVDAYTMTGNTISIGSNRISYLFDLQGPSMSIDTACSSSLVALHQACHSLRTGETELAIAGGVNMLLHPLAFVGFSKASMLSPTGRCKVFDASGDGYVRSEGAAIVVLKPLVQAEIDGDNIYAVIAASGVNCDGKTNGLTVPNSEAQAQLITKVCQQANIEANQIVYVEAHGTGTAVGDPLEAKALSIALGQKRAPDNPLLIGSVKTNLGHLEVASGMAGLLKTILCLQHKAIPKNLHFKTPNPHIPFQQWQLKVVDEFTELTPTDSPLLMGVNSFGFGGANAHVLLEEYPNIPLTQSVIVESCSPLYLSARSPIALKQLTRIYANFIEANIENYANIAWTAWFSRKHLTHRLITYANQPTEIITALRQFELSQTNTQSVYAEFFADHSEVALVYSGNGCQWLGMGQTLFQQSTVFRHCLETIDQLWQQYADFSIVEILLKPESEQMQATEIAQPLLFAIQIGLTELLQSLGLKAKAAFGHSVGEIAAAWVAGALTLEQAVLIIYHRSFAQGQTRGLGKMAAVGLSTTAVMELLTELQLTEQIVIAGINSPISVTLSGEEAGLFTLQTHLQSKNIFFRMLDLDYAFHSPYMDSIQHQILTHLAELTPDTAHKMQFISTVTGNEYSAEQLTASYWWDNIRQPVEFHRAVDYLIDQGITIFIEIGSHPVLLRYIQQSLQAKQKIGKTLATIKRQQESLSQIIECVFHSYLLGAEIESTVYFSDFQHKIRLPNYPWQRESYWHELTEKGYGLIERRLVNPLLGYRLKDADAAWENALDTVLMPWLADHEIGGAIVLPASAYLEMALAASKSWLGGNDFEIEEIEISAPIVLDAEHLKPIKFYCIPNDGTFTIRSGDAITRHVSGRLLGQPMQKCQPLMEYPIMSEADFHFSAEQHYQFTQKIGLHYGKAFQGVDQIWLWTQAKIAWAQLRFPNTLVEEDHYLLHPVLLDSCFQLLASVFHQQIQQGYLQAMIPVRIGKLRFYGQKQLPYWCKVELKRYHRRSIVADFYLWDQERQLIAVLQQVRFRSVNFIKAAEHYPPFYYYTGELKPLLIEELTAVEINKTVLKQQIDFYFSQAEITQQRQQHFTEVVPLFEAYIAAYCYETVQLLSNSTATIIWDELIETATIIPEQFALLRRILFILEQEQWLIIEPNQLIWHWQSTTDIPESAMIWRTVVADYPDYLPELILLAQSAAHLPAILRGESHATAVLSPAKSSTYEHFYSASRTATIMNTVIVRMMKQWLTQLPENRRCRILCCSSGQAELTRLLIPLFPENRFDFILIDHHEDIIDHAIMQFESCLGFRAKQFNLAQLIHQLPEELNGGFDWIIVSHALHQLESISQIITVLQKLLIHNGYLLIQEREPDRFTDLTFGLQPDWWVSTAQQQFSSRLRPIEVWANYLQQQGFSDIQKFTEPEKWEQAGVFVLLAQNPNQIAIPLAILPKQTWLILFASTAITDELYQHLSATLTAQGHNVFGLQMLATAEWICLQQAQHPAQSLALWLQTIENYQQIIYLPSIEQAYNHNLSINLAAQRCEWMRQLFQAIPETSAITVSVVTKGGAVYQPLGDTAISPTEAAVWGLVRVAMNEYPNLTIRLFDLTDFQSTAAISYRLGTALLNAEAENEWLISEGAAQVLRMQRQVLRSEFNHTSQLPFVLDFKVAGSLHNLYWRSLPATVELAANQIQIRPIAVGLNFRDVMYAMGLLADEAVENGFAGASLGMELAGIVERVGAEVKNFHQGDAVISFAPASFSTRVITQTTATVLKPVEWTFEQAATIPTTFFTVYYALHHLARLQAGEKILIHGAAGGVGLAAIQYAQWIGAEIFATAGSEEKRQFVKLLGADHVMDSRNMAFADQILQLTEGKGVDVILNSLSGEAIWRNLTILRPFGRFLELGKRDFYENSKIGLRPFRNNISYYGIDADQLLIERADLAGQLFKEMMQLFENKVFHPLPLRVFPAKDIEEAFRYMQQSRHIGKIVVSFENSQPLNVHTENSVAIELKLSATASYVVTGGLGGFGLKTAEWLVSKGAKHLWLLGRQGVKHSDAELTIQRLRDAGVQIEIGAVDVCDFIALEKIFERINQGSAPLKGVIHAAAVIDDALIRHLDAQQLQRVLAPKIQGAWNLHQLTQSVTLDFLVLYSSMTTFIGNPGQANYVAANHYLESLALYRRQQGLPALAVAWGAIEDVGFLTRHPQLKDILETRLGSKALTSDMALTLLEKLLLNQATVNAVFNVDWATLSRFMPMAKSPKYTQQIIQAQRLGTETHQHQDLKTILAGLPLSEAVPVVAQLLAQEIGQILRLPAEKIDHQKSVFELGMDSLMGMELAIAVEEHFAVKLPLMALAEGVNIDQLAVKIVELVKGDEAEVFDSQRDSMQAFATRHEGQLSVQQQQTLTQLLKTMESDGVKHE